MRREVSLRGDGNSLLVVLTEFDGGRGRERKREREMKRREGRQTHFWRESSSGVNGARDLAQNRGRCGPWPNFTDSGFN